jgi:hypothetical protein
MELSKILMQLKLEHQEVFEKLEELVEDVVWPLEFSMIKLSLKMDTL